MQLEANMQHQHPDSQLRGQFEEYQKDISRETSKELVVKIVQKIGLKLYRWFGTELVTTYFYSMSPPDLPEEVVGRLNIGNTCQRLTGAQAEVFSSAMELSISKVRRRLARGDQCYYLMQANTIIHYSWVQYSGSHRISSAAQSVEMQRDQIVIYDCFTAPAARGFGLYPATLNRILQDCFRDGTQLAWIYTTKRNVRSQKGLEKVGFHMACVVRSLRIGAFQVALLPSKLFHAALGLSVSIKR